MALNPKQQRFTQEYLIDLNATQAAIRAGYAVRTARQQGSRLLTNAAVMEVIQTAKAERSDRIKIDADYVLRRLFEIESFDLSSMYNDRGDLLNPSEWPEGAERVVSGVDVQTAYAGDDDEPLVTKKIKLESRTKAIELMGRHVGVKAFDTTVTVELPKVIKRYIGKTSGD
jgi:phage terminase small subunit